MCFKWKNPTGRRAPERSGMREQREGRDRCAFLIFGRVVGNFSQIHALPVGSYLN